MVDVSILVAGLEGDVEVSVMVEGYLLEMGAEIRQVRVGIPRHVAKALAEANLPRYIRRDVTVHVCGDLIKDLERAGADEDVIDWLRCLVSEHGNGILSFRQDL